MASFAESVNSDYQLDKLPEDEVRKMFFKLPLEERPNLAAGSYRLCSIYLQICFELGIKPLPLPFAFYGK